MFQSGPAIDMTLLAFSGLSKGVAANKFKERQHNNTGLEMQSFSVGFFRAVQRSRRQLLQGKGT